MSPNFKDWNAQYFGGLCDSHDDDVQRDYIQKTPNVLVVMMRYTAST